MKRRSFFYGLSSKVFTVSISVILTGCIGANISELDTWMENNPTDIHVTIEPIPEVQPYTAFIYQASNNVDPFSSSKLNAGLLGVSKSIHDTRPKQLLEEFDLERLKMVGVLSKNGVSYALIKSPKGLHRSSVGDYLGQNNGKIVKITESEVELSETVQEVNGEWIQRAETLYLSESDQ